MNQSCLKRLEAAYIAVPIDNLICFKTTPVELLLYESGKIIVSEVRETQEVFQVLYNFHFSKALSDYNIRSNCATSNKYLCFFVLYPVTKV